MFYHEGKGVLSRRCPVMNAKWFRRVCSVLAAVLMLLTAAAGESSGTACSWEDRLAEARLKYNEETVHIYADSRVRNRSGKINIRF